MDQTESMAERYRRVLASDLITSPGLRARISDDQEVEVAHVLVDPLQTLVFCRLHGEAAPAPQPGRPFVTPLAPEELLYQSHSISRCNGFHVLALPPVYAYRRSIVLGLPAAVLTIPVDPARGYQRLRVGNGGPLAEGGVPGLRVLSVAASDTCTTVSFCTEAPGLQLAGLALRPPQLEAPAGDSSALWREAARLGASPRFQFGEAGRQILPNLGVQAQSVPEGVHLPHQGMSSGGAHNRTFSLRFGAVPWSSTGIRLTVSAAYRWEPVSVLAEVPAPVPGERTSLLGHSLDWGGGRLDLLAWEEGDGYFTLVAVPAAGFRPPKWPAWLPDLRLVLGDASAGLAAIPCTDGTLVFHVAKELLDAAGSSWRFGIRAIGHGLPAAERVIPFEV